MRKQRNMTEIPAIRGKSVDRSYFAVDGEEEWFFVFIPVFCYL